MFTIIKYMLEEVIDEYMPDIHDTLYQFQLRASTVPTILREIFFSEEWKNKAFMFIARRKKDWITGYEISKEFGVGASTAYRYLDRLEKYGVVRRPKEGKKRRKEVKITNFGLWIHGIVEKLSNWIDTRTSADQEVS